MYKLIFLILSFYVPLLAQSDTALVLLKNIDSTIVQDVRYATKNNFTGKVLYPTSKVYLRKSAADSLSAANKFINKKNKLKIKIFDGYRPLSVQKFMWTIIPDSRYVANPAKGSRHNRGAAVDITLIDNAGNELDMGTGYDNFTEKARYNFPGLTDEQKANRKLLRDLMIRFGFIPLETEWWHFDFKGWEKYSIPDKPIK